MSKCIDCGKPIKHQSVTGMCYKCEEDHNHEDAIADAVEEL